MDRKQLNKLAEKYWEGKTTETEEKTLRDTLRWGETPKGLESIAEYLNYSQQIKSATLGDEFDQAIMQKIEPPKSRIFKMDTLVKIAAAVILLLVATFVFQKNDVPASIAHQSEFIDTYEDSEEAYREVRKAMMMISSGMSSGMAHTQVLGKFDEAMNKSQGANQKIKNTKKSQ